ncbi:hypothetical protein FGO68_gene15853 [Halteria grandinella]|uniref:Uncharacterized protein n=1 Tax=Halteria grandinella TaxID=5974 RepID=A0A8J8T4T5_HALGN|nr:hypothetical protein FGO68_gene15853 [Halteria grandinella]
MKDQIILKIIQFKRTKSIMKSRRLKCKFQIFQQTKTYDRENPELPSAVSHNVLKGLYDQLMLVIEQISGVVFKNDRILFLKYIALTSKDLLRESDTLLSQMTFLYPNDLSLKQWWILKSSSALLLKEEFLHKVYATL